MGIFAGDLEGNVCVLLVVNILYHNLHIKDMSGSESERAGVPGSRGPDKLLSDLNPPVLARTVPGCPAVHFHT